MNQEKKYRCTDNRKTGIRDARSENVRATMYDAVRAGIKKFDDSSLECGVSEIPCFALCF